MDILKKFIGGAGGAAPAQSKAPAADDDFADFAGVPEPSPASMPSVQGSISATPLSDTAAGAGASSIPKTGPPALPRPFTKWYRVWERTYPSDFYAELCILPFLLVLIFVHMWGMRKNRRKARMWLASHGPVLQQEFATVGFSGRAAGDGDGVTDLAKLADSDGAPPNDILREKAANEYISYASGRQNIAFLDLKLTLAKRYNPVGRIGEEVVAFFVESVPVPRERMEATAYVFDGKENELVAALQQAGEGGAQRKEKSKSAYDGFVWAVVHKDAMQTLRDSRYDLSLTSTKDHPRLPTWATVMSENAEITETLLTPPLVQAIEQCGDALEALIISDQPIDKPIKLNDTIPKKRISLAFRLPPSTDAAATSASVPLFTHFLRLADTLAASAHFRPEVLRRVRATRDDEARKLQKVDETEKAEERRSKADRERKRERDDKLRGLNAEEQRKFLEKERAQDLRKSQKGRTVRA